MRYCAVCRPRSASLFMVNLYIQSYILHSYGCLIDSTVLWSHNTVGVLVSFCYLFVSHAMYFIKFEQTLVLRIYPRMVLIRGVLNWEILA